MYPKKRLLWVSPYAPYDEVAHAGGKCHNFYIKYLQKSNRYKITLLSLCLKSEEKKLDLAKYGIDHKVFVMDRTGIDKLLRLGISGLELRNPFDRYGGVCLPYERRQMLKLLDNYYEKNETPDIIILQWTFSLMFIDELKKKFPHSRIVAIEEDVTFLNYNRKRKRARGSLGRFFWKQRYAIMKRTELAKLYETNLIVTNNPKDTRLLLDNKMKKDKIFTAAPYIDDYSECVRRSAGKDLLFFGAMSRAENYQSAIWFIRNVMPFIHDAQVRFVIVGANPDLSLRRYENKRIIVTGYVESVRPWFEKCLCLVAPLVGGAGIKIKILEAMSAGVPVLTNEIGIEGIHARNRRDFLLCRKPQEYADAIKGLLSGRIDAGQISENARRYIQKNYYLPAKLDIFMDRLDRL